MTTDERVQIANEYCDATKRLWEAAVDVVARYRLASQDAILNAALKPPQKVLEEIGRECFSPPVAPAPDPRALFRGNSPTGTTASAAPTTEAKAQ